jgi:hypothetical protein
MYIKSISALLGGRLHWVGVLVSLSSIQPEVKDDLTLLGRGSISLNYFSCIRRQVQCQYSDPLNIISNGDTLF